MGKERFTINPFPALELSDAEKNQLLELGRTIIEANFERDEPFFEGGRKVDYSRWKLAKEREHMLVHTERPEYKGADAMSNTMHSSTKLPAILSVGRVEGKLDDMMFGVVNPTLEDMRIKASYVHDFDGAAVLSTIVEPSIDEPFNSVVVKWMEMDIPLRRTGVVQNRDYVYLECTGFAQMPNGERAGYHFLHSIDFPQIPKLSNRVRGDLSICGFFRQVAPNVIDVCKTGLMDPAGDMIRMLAVPVMTEAFLSPLRYVHCGQMRKLTWKMEKAHAEARLHGAPNPGSSCVTCSRPSTGWTLGKSATTCKCCFRVLCSGCKIKKKISLVTADLTLSERKINFCTACLAASSLAAAAEIASLQIMENGRKSGIIRRRAYRHVVRVWLPEEQEVAVGVADDRILVQIREFAQTISGDAVDKALMAQLPLKILFRDDAVVVVDKPANILSVDGTDPDAPLSVYRCIANVCPEARMVHRLDQETSGLLVIALTKSAAQSLNAQFRDRSVEKTYVARVLGWVEEENDNSELTRQVRVPMEKHPTLYITITCPSLMKASAILILVFITIVSSNAELSPSGNASTADVINVRSTAGSTEPPFKFGTPTFFGSGCPTDTVTVVPSTDGQAVSVLFSKFTARTAGADVNRDRKSCNLAVPVDVQSGVSIGIFRVDYRGNAFVPNQSGSYGQFDAEYYFAGQRGPVASEKYSPGTDKDLFISHEVGVSAVVWSPCGASTNFRVNSAITAAKQTGGKEDTQVAIDSVDSTVQAGFHYYLATRKC
ncbi:hypothetical protein G195_002565 [Phytophthora kernoviae 00238/432]|uniref:Pseudouridine synthase RsuA/RluA-like domain-containing protein n=1 Tax=Phytophthora kernoviae 00238/432 TaxID=1284355 RepID=A0A8J4WNQ6_9STRA|nr:hypothetical protein G195_002565 [Phytophthora kernoviae 00238/432]